MKLRIVREIEGTVRPQGELAISGKAERAFRSGDFLLVPGEYTGEPVAFLVPVDVKKKARDAIAGTGE